MKVKDVLKNFDCMGKVKILEVYVGGDGEEECYSGTAFDCPWAWADMAVDTNEDGEGMFVGIDEGTHEPYLGIYVKEDDD